MPEAFFWVANTLPPTCPASLERSHPKNGRDLAEPQDVCLECLCFRVLTAMGEVLTKWVAGGVPPLGAFNGIGAKLALIASKNFGARPFFPKNCVRRHNKGSYYVLSPLALDVKTAVGRPWSGGLVVQFLMII